VVRSTGAVLVAAVDGSLAALHADTGSVLWCVRVDDA
jgi:outer membrane protein assembly factor BamB